MQVADSMSSRGGCPYREAQLVQQVEPRAEHGFLGIRYVVHDGFADIDTVIPGTPAEAVDLRPGDHVLALNNSNVGSASEFQERIFNMHPGSTPSLVVERRGQLLTVQPTLVAWPSISY
ncbi:MAG TPA: PDZ domain-containing protein [Kofleriaceae bacterium]|nr:PDZ domain-containing protein [Kofleriaceae bacterium]